MGCQFFAMREFRLSQVTARLGAPGLITDQICDSRRSLTPQISFVTRQ